MEISREQQSILNAIRTNYIKEKCDNTQQNSKRKEMKLSTT